MKRFLSGTVIGITFLVLLFFSWIPFLLNICVGILAVVSVYEALFATKYVESKALMGISMLFAFIVPFLPNIKGRPSFSSIIFIFALILFVTLILSYKSFTFEHICVVFLLSVIIPYFFSTLIYVREIETGGRFYLYLVFVCAWMTDVGAFTAGKLFGKHKLAPIISPKKTIEGAVAGVITSALSAIICALIYSIFDKTDFNFIVLFISGLGAGILAQIGDLSASVIKRSFGVKDFGSIIPGHGGVLDRFDSIIFVSPFLYIVFSFIPALV